MAKYMRISGAALLATLLASCGDSDLYWCNRPEMCSHSADVRNAEARAEQKAQQEARDARQQQEIDAAQPALQARVAEYDRAISAAIARMTPEQRALYFQLMRQRALELQRQRDDIDWWNQQTGTLKQCSGLRCW